jgi:hypothetical protein
MKSSFSPSINKTKIIKSLNLSLQSSSPTSLSKKSNFYILPPIDPITKKYVLNKPSSMITKFIHDRTKTIINNTNAELKKPIKLSFDYNISKPKKTKEKQKSAFFITNDGKANNKESSLNNDINLILEKINGSDNKKANNDMNDNLNYNNNIDNISSLSIDRKIKENRINILMPKFRRKRIYQPIISENWKFKNGLRITIGNEKTNILTIKNDVEYQYKIINDEFKLLEDNYSFYKSRIIIKNNYYDAFRAMPLISKIRYNKYLEEAIGILYILPQLILVEFYKLIKNYSSVNIPKPDLFKEKYIFNEDKNLKYNNNLLILVFEFFKSCYEVYGTLIKEVNDMYLKINEFINVINCLEKARYNLSYLSTSSENAIKKYYTDIKFIQKIINEKGVSKNDLKMKKQFGFKKNEEKQRKLRIETALYNKNEEENENIKKDNNMKRKFNSVMESKLIDGLMKYFTKDVKNQVTTQRINKQIDGNYDEEDEEIKQKHKVVTIDL